MRTEKVSLSLDQAVLAEARAAVGARKLSSYINHALRLQLQHDRLAGLLQELEQEAGSVDPRVMEEIRRAWPSPEERGSRRRDA